MNKMMEYSRKRPALFGGILFGVISLILNVVWILAFHIAHVYDIIHVFPVIFIMEGFLDDLGGYISSEFYLMPIGVIMDMIIGGIIGLIAGKVTKHKKPILYGLLMIFAVYWIVITWQWLPIL